MTRPFRPSLLCLVLPVLLVLLVLGVTAPRAAVAAPAVATATSTPTETAVYLESDPSTFLLGGFSAHVRVAPSVWPRWTVGAGAYALDFPRLMVDLAPANRDEGWQVRMRLGYGVFVDRTLWSRRGDDGLFSGVQLALQHFRVRNDRLGPAAADSTNWLIMPRIGYLFRPFDTSGFYLLGWLGVGATGRLSGDTRVGADSYQVLPVIAFAAVHVGWSF